MAALLDPAFADVGWRPTRLLRWESQADPDFYASFGFSKWNGMPPLPNRATLTFRAKTGHVHTHRHLLRSSEQTPFILAAEDVRRRLDPTAVADLPEVLRSEVRVPAPGPPDTFEYLEAEDLLGRVRVVATLVPHGRAAHGARVAVAVRHVSSS